LFVLEKAVVKKTFFLTTKTDFPTTNNGFAPPQLLLVDIILVLSIHLADEACIALQYCFVY
jgi:hypothetical protein